MRKLKLTANTIDNILESLLKRSPNQYTEYEATVNEIVNNVRENGDEAIFAYTKKFDGADINESNIIVTKEEIEEALDFYREGSSLMFNLSLGFAAWLRQECLMFNV